MLVSLDDRLCQQYQAAADQAKPRLTVEKVLEKTLRRFAPFPATSRAVVLQGQPLQDLELLLGGGPLTSGEDLLTRIHQRAGITLGDIRVHFSAAQLAELQLRAEKQGKDPKDLVADIVKQMEWAFFYEATPAR